MTVRVNTHLLLYEALQRLAQFVTHSDSVAVDREAVVRLQALEVQVQRAVVAAGDGDELAVEHLRQLRR